MHIICAFNPFLMKKYLLYLVLLGACTNAPTSVAYTYIRNTTNKQVVIINFYPFSSATIFTIEPQQSLLVKTEAIGGVSGDDPPDVGFDIKYIDSTVVSFSDGKNLQFLATDLLAEHNILNPDNFIQTGTAHSNHYFSKTRQTYYTYTLTQKDYENAR